MKKILSLIWSVLASLSSLIVLIPGILWYGKIPKVSMYHLWDGGINYKDIFNDTMAQSKEFKALDEPLIRDVLYDIAAEAIEISNDIPIRDNKGKIIGCQSRNIYLLDIYNKVIKNYK